MAEKRLLDHVWIPKDEYRQGGGGWDDIPFLEPLAKVNIFVGPNNSGKSRMLRRLFWCDVHGIDTARLTSPQLNSQRQEQASGFRGLGESYGEMRNKIPGLQPMEIKPFPGTRHSLEVAQYADALRKVLVQDVRCKVSKQLAARAAKELSFLDDFLPLILDKTEPPKAIYVPTLRGLRPPCHSASEDEDSYYARTRDDYFIFDVDKRGEAESKLKGAKRIFTGLGLYESVRKNLLGRREERDSIRAYEEFLSRELFGGKTVTLTPEKDKDVLLFEIDHEERSAFDLGDGIQQLVIMTYPAFMDRNQRMLLFIEEPELYLHPGMQRRLLEIFLKSKDFARCQVFMATHSNHLLDMTVDLSEEDVSVFRFSKTYEDSDDGKKVPRFEITHMGANSTGERSLLDDLGVRNSSVFLTNCTIWMEGISDRIYLRKYLELYQDELEKQHQQAEEKDKVTPKPPRFREDIHFSLAEYGGANLTHWAFTPKSGDSSDGSGAVHATRLCGSALVIADCDEHKNEKHEGLESELGENYYCIGGREIENLLHPEILVEVVKTYKVEVVKALPEHNDYINETIGTFIEDKLIVGKPKQRFASKSKALEKPKGEFARRACALMDSPDQMSDAARKLAKKVYNFILEHNPTETAI
ncbi:MAG TPA: AAA family ATPase [Candidatus Hydrogenedentes bacterium]|nr:AAA family ATPase [Candidatus Hydrogenedentota bacterium]HPG65506.1 AAA family ATPase [Candidatus Hydrogenedentota bacterium]